MEQIMDGVEEYPKFIYKKEGIKVKINNRVDLPGVFSNYLMAERAYANYESRKSAALAAKKKAK